MYGTYDVEVIRALQRKDRRQSALMDSIKARIEKYLKQYEKVETSKER